MAIKDRCRCEVRAERRTPITLYRPVISTGTDGSRTEGTPTNIGTAWVRYHKMHGTELYEARELFNAAEVKFFGGYEDLGTLVASDYVELDSVRYDILDIDDIDWQHRDVVLLTSVHGEH